MELTLKKHNQIPQVMLRRLGYALYVNKFGKHSYVRRIHGTDFPRFHLYINTEDERTIGCAVHLDQKRPSYEGSRAHGGDYDSETVRAEAKRLQLENQQ